MITNRQQSPRRRWRAAAVLVGAIAGAGAGAGGAADARSPASTDTATPSASEAATESTAAADDSTAGSTETIPPATFPVTIEHALGSTEIPAMPETIVSASATMTGHLLAIDAPVVAAQVLPGESPLADDNGFLLQWADVAIERGVEPIAGPEVNIEAIAAAEPDLIIGNSFGGDAVTEDVYSLLSEIAPTIVIDHSAMTWQDLAVILAGATGRTDEANTAIDEFDTLVTDAAAQLDTTYPVVAGVITEDGVNVLTGASSHGQLLTSLGLTVVSPEGDSLEGEQGAQERADVVGVSPELIPDEFGDATVLFVFGEPADVDAALDLYPTLAATPAAAEGRLVPLGVESFRLDRYSATLVVERLVEAIPAAGATEGTATEGSTSATFGEEEQAAADAWAMVFDSAVGFDDKAPHLDDADALRETVEAYTTAGETMGGITLEPTAVVVDGDGATVTYDVLFGGTVAYADQEGSIALVDGTWVVGRDEFCGFMASARNACPT
ncbi:MAG: Fe2+-enterobactin ABC transporter substrate-binding protein [Desertimonas sp.]